MRKFLPLLLMPLILLGCATKAPPINYEKIPSADVTNATVIEDSDFDSIRTILAPKINRSILIRKGPFNVPGFDTFYDEQSILIRGFRDKKTKKLEHQIYITIGYNGAWRFYSSVNFIGGEAQQVKQLKSNVIGCSSHGSCNLQEIIGVSISDSMLRTGQNDLQFRLNSKIGQSDIISISRSYINGYLSKADAS